MTTPTAAARKPRISRRDLGGRMFVVQAGKISAVGALAALLGSAQALGWVDVAPHRASEMAYPTFAGASASVLFILLGLAIAPAATRTKLWPIAGRWLVGAAVLFTVGTWLLGQG